MKSALVLVIDATHLVTPTTMPQTIANSLPELLTTPYSIECFRRVYLWKHYLYAALGPRHVDEVNQMLKELQVVSYKYPLPTALEMIVSPTYPQWVILHDHPEVTYRSIQYILHGVGEEIIDPSDLQAAETAALAELRVELNNSFHQSKQQSRGS